MPAGGKRWKDRAISRLAKDNAVLNRSRSPDQSDKRKSDKIPIRAFHDDGVAFAKFITRVEYEQLKKAPTDEYKNRIYVENRPEGSLTMVGTADGNMIDKQAYDREQKKKAQIEEHYNKAQ